PGFIFAIPFSFPFLLSLPPLLFLRLVSLLFLSPSSPLSSPPSLLSLPSPSPLFLLSFLSPLSSPSSPFPSLLFFLSLSFSFLSFFSSSS
ncbi:hypothetical protein ACXWR7_10605, partial [Streptococcus pyogenes]